MEMFPHLFDTEMSGGVHVKTDGFRDTNAKTARSGRVIAETDCGTFLCFERGSHSRITKDAE